MSHHTQPQFQNDASAYCPAVPPLTIGTGWPTYRRPPANKPFWPLLSNRRVVRRVYQDDRNHQWVVIQNGREQWEALDSLVPINHIPVSPGSNQVPVIRNEQFQAIPAWRRSQLEGSARRMVTRIGAGTMNYYDVGDFLNELASFNDMTELEKAYLWTFFTGGRGRERMGGLRGYEGGWYNVSIDGARNDTRDNTRPLTSPNHSWLGFTDSHHGGYMWNDQTGAFNSPRQTTEEINNYENNPLTGGDGDRNASERIVRAFRAFACGGFRAFARAWNDGFTTGR